MTDNVHKRAAELADRLENAWMSGWPAGGAAAVDTVEFLRALAAQPQDGIRTDRLEKIIDAYVDDYEMRGDDGDHTPTEGERAMIKDAIMGLLVDDDWDAEWGAHVQRLVAQRSAQPQDERGAMRAALEAILRDPHGCPFCDSGKLRNSAKDHAAGCGYALARAALENRK